MALWWPWCFSKRNLRVLVIADIKRKVYKFRMPRVGGLQVGDRILLSGGYDPEPQWLAGLSSIEGLVLQFIPGQNDAVAAVIKIENRLNFAGVTGDILVLELRYHQAIWASSEIVHIELCDFVPEAMPWQHRRKGMWVESHASYRKLVA